MILVNEIKGLMKAKCLTQSDVAKMLAISLKTFNTKLNSGVFNSEEIQILINVLDIDDPIKIFFAK